LQFKDENFLVIAFGLAEVTLVVLSFFSGFTLPRLHFASVLFFSGFFLKKLMWHHGAHSHHCALQNKHNFGTNIPLKL